MKQQIISQFLGKSAYIASKVIMQSWAVYSLILESGILPQLQFLTFTYDVTLYNLAFLCENSLKLH